MSSQPAHRTKHIPLLHYPFASSTFALSQLSDGVSNGTALWLGGQCLAMYLLQMHNKFKPPNSTHRPRAIELGSGIGLTALALSSLGWDVLATDIPHVISAVLEKNIKNNFSALPIGSGTIQIRELDWSVPPEKWTWDHELVIASHSELTSAAAVSLTSLCPPFDLIFSADTVYSTELIEPILRTLHALSILSASTSGSHFPPILLCIERRDPVLVDRLLTDAKGKWQFSVERIPHKKVIKAVEKAAQWDKSEWDGVELWKLKLNAE
ncbi:hypothetical protein BDZ97DRAFT_1915092 [Flammula alnicola]|nr:hypothetical protein BDZ97DRAFT_1915092 [Flammula alnicola]